VKLRAQSALSQRIAQVTAGIYLKNSYKLLQSIDG
jgi:hypothetical protein